MIDRTQPKPSDYRNRDGVMIYRIGDIVLPNGAPDEIEEYCIVVGVYKGKVVVRRQKDKACLTLDGAKVGFIWGGNMMADPQYENLVERGFTIGEGDWHGIDESSGKTVLA